MVSCGVYVGTPDAALASREDRHRLARISGLGTAVPEALEPLGSVDEVPPSERTRRLAGGFPYRNVFRVGRKRRLLYLRHPSGLRSRDERRILRNVDRWQGSGTWKSRFNQHAL